MKSTQRKTTNKGAENRSRNELEEAAKTRTAQWRDKLNMNELNWVPLSTKFGSGTCLHIGSVPGKGEDAQNIYMDYQVKSTKKACTVIFHTGSPLPEHAWKGMNFSEIR